MTKWHLQTKYVSLVLHVSLYLWYHLSFSFILSCEKLSQVFTSRYFALVL